MHIEEEDRYKVACHLDRRDLRLHGITMDDLINRTPLGYMFIHKAGQLAKESTGYVWPGCGLTMQMDIFETEVVLYFSERIEDYLYNLQQTAYALDSEQTAGIEQMIDLIRKQSDEDKAREIIRNFEGNVKAATDIM